MESLVKASWFLSDHALAPLPHPPGTGRALSFHVGRASPASGGTQEGRRVLLAPAVSEARRIQNNQYAKVAYLRVTCSEPLRPTLDSEGR